MKDEEMIKQIAEYYELPVEQVALIWSFADYIFHKDMVCEITVHFIKKKMCT
jgi:hypothetical protein